MKLQLSANRSLRLALFLSLLIHGVLLLAWRYGGWFGQLENSSSGMVSPTKLEAYLRSATVISAPNDNENSSTTTELPTPRQDSATPIVPTFNERPNGNATRESHQVGVPLDLLYYYPVNELEIRPLIKQQPTLDESPAGMELAVNGRALLELLIENNGRINSVNVLENNLPASHVSQLEQAFSHVEYTPGRKSGRLVRSRLLIEVVYVDGVMHHLPEAPVNLGVFPSAPDPHVPITLPPDRHKRKSNPPLH